MRTQKINIGQDSMTLGFHDQKPTIEYKGKIYKKFFSLTTDHPLLLGTENQEHAKIVAQVINHLVKRDVFTFIDNPTKFLKLYKKQPIIQANRLTDPLLKNPCWKGTNLLIFYTQNIPTFNLFKVEMVLLPNNCLCISYKPLSSSHFSNS